ncbi:MAG: STAS domain-containing protein [Acidimicrobiia bacterium]
MEDGTDQDLLTAELERLGSSAAILRLTGEVDISSAHLLTTQFKTVTRDGLGSLVIDATGVTFMDSTGLHALVEGKRMVHHNGTQIVLVPSRQVRRVLELVFPEPLFAARVDTVEEALARLDGAVERVGDID